MRFGGPGSAMAKNLHLGLTHSGEVIRKEYSFAREPTGSAYRSLVDFGLAHSAFVSCVVRRDLGLGSRGQSVLRKPEPSLVERGVTRAWPGTELLGGTALLHTFSFDESVAGVLRRSVHGLYDWQQPELPEDLAFLRDTGPPLLTSISHEHDGFLTLSDDERADLDALAPMLAEVLE